MKRKDSKGRILKDKEYQRKDGVYMYRYTGADKKRCYVYAGTLAELRKKENAIQKDMDDGILYGEGEISVSELLGRYMKLKEKSLKTNSLRAYSTVTKRLKSDPFGFRTINSVKLSDAKLWMLSLHEQGLKRNTMSVYMTVLKPAFEMAVDDDIIRKNPFKFKLSDIVSDDSEKKVILTKEQQDIMFRFIQEYRSDMYRSDIFILLKTGMRVSELYGLCMSDISFDERKIYVRRQLCRTADKPFFIESTKSSSGTRCIPMLPGVYEELKEVIRTRPIPGEEPVVDGCSGFLFLSKLGLPRVAMHLQGFVRSLNETIQREYGEAFPHISPHTLRHTFCTEMEQMGMDIVPNGSLKDCCHIGCVLSCRLRFCGTQREEYIL